jgi:hypothetical protein
MPIITTGLANLLIVLAIGMAAGLLFNRYGQTWLTGNSRHGTAM